MPGPSVLVSFLDEADYSDNPKTNHSARLAHKWEVRGNTHLKKNGIRTKIRHA